MKRSLGLIVFTLVFAALPLAAQVTSPDSITVSANNVGVFTLTLSTIDVTPTQYLFGDIAYGATANASGTEALAGTTVGSNTTFQSGSGAVAWSVESAPKRTVRIYNSSSAAPGPAGTWGTTSNLAMVVVNPSVGTTCPEITYGTTGDSAAGCANGILIHTMANVGRNASAASGNLRLKVTVADTDPVGPANWTVQLTALGL